jgi:hypothetical protein
MPNGCYDIRSANRKDGGRLFKQVHRPRWFFIRRLARRGGQFATAESSPRAQLMTELWHSRWPGFPPTADGVEQDSVDIGDRHLRLHSLPGSKRYAESVFETAEIVHRHEVVLAELLGESSSGEIVVFGLDWGSNDWAGGWTRKRLPGRWPWMIWYDTRDEEDAQPQYFWGSSITRIDQLRQLLSAAAVDVARIRITNPDMTWLYWPYPGGADIYARSTAERDALRDAHSDWLPVER